MREGTRGEGTRGEGTRAYIPLPLSIAQHLLVLGAFAFCEVRSPKGTLPLSIVQHLLVLGVFAFCEVRSPKGTRMPLYSSVW